MAEDKNKAEFEGGEFMIQDRDHLGHAGQMGDQANQGRRQSEQSEPQAGNRQQGGDQQSDGQQGMAYRRNYEFI
jgi:hypothetical protein